MSRNGVLRVLVVDDDARVRRALQELSDASGGMQVVASVGAAGFAVIVAAMIVGNVLADRVAIRVWVPSPLRAADRYRTETAAHLRGRRDGARRSRAGIP
jgi:hypothetical protein